MYEDIIEAKASSQAVFSRGMKIAGIAGDVRISSTEEQSDGTVVVHAKVRGSGSRPYEVQVVFDPSAAGIVAYGCTCPAFEQWPGMCKHAVATALVYGSSLSAPAADAESPTLSAPPSSEGNSAPVNSSDDNEHSTRPKSASAEAVKYVASAASERFEQDGKAAISRHSRPDRPLSQPEVRTSPQIQQMVRSYAERSQRAARLSADCRADDAVPQTEEPVDLQCTIAAGADAYRSSYYNDDMWRLGLKVVRGKVSYVVKHIDEVVGAWRTGASYTYGKNLAFVHRPSAFTEHANSLLEMLGGIVDAQRSMFDAREMRNYYYESSKLSTKTLPLLPGQIIDILAIEVGRKVVYEYEERGPGFTDEYGFYRRGEFVKRKATVPVVAGDPALEVDIAPIEGGGFDLSVSPGTAECIVGDDERACLVTRKAVYLASEGFSRALGPFCASVLPFESEYPLQISNGEMPAFCAAVLPALRTYAVLDEPSGLDAIVPPAPEFVFHVGLENGLISCNAMVCYGSDSVGLFDDARSGGPVRDVAREMAVQATVREFFPFGDIETPSYDAGGYGPEGRVFGAGVYRDPVDPYFEEDDDASYYALFHDGLGELSALGEVFLSERLRSVSVRPSPSVRVEATLADGALELRADSSDLSDEELIAYLSSYRRKQRFIRLDNGDILRIDGAVQQVADLADSLGIASENLVDGTAELAPNKTLFVDAMLKRAGGVRFERNEAFRKIVREFETIADADIPEPDELHAQLRPYQAEGYRWLCVLGATGFGGILADDMGLGKTLQAIAYCCHMAESGERRPAIVVCPASLVYNWMAEIGRFAPGLKAAAVLGAKSARRAIITEAAEYDVLVTSYDLLKRDIELYEGFRFSTAVLDEAQYIKNAGTKAAKSAKRIQADAHFALTGTPVENRLSELWSIFDFLMPGALGSSEQFAKRFATPIGNGDEAAARRLQALVGPFILRRLKGDVLTDLPEKNESVVFAQMEGEQLKLYRASASKLARSLTKQLPEEFRTGKLQVLAELTKLRQLACDPRLVFENYEGGSAKLDTCVELIENAVEGGHSVLVFSQFTSIFALIGERLAKLGVAYLELTGATSKEERVRLVERFQAHEAPVFLISLKAGGVGLNLTAADIVIHYDPWWNLAAQNQATDRAHRIGQQREVSVFKLIAKDTVEEKIVEMQQAKQDLADAVVGGDAVSASNITREDILALLDAGE